MIVDSFYHEALQEKLRLYTGQAMYDAILRSVNENQIVDKGMRIGLNKSESLAIYLYTYSDDKGRSFFRLVNRYLREGLKTASGLEIALSEQLDKGAIRLPIHTGPVFRRTDIPPDIKQSMAPGQTFQDPGFLSASQCDPDLHFGQDVLVINSKSGRDLSAMSDHPHEKEVLFVKDTTFHIVATKKVGHATVAVLEEIKL